jgi:hypothetical protein
MCDAPKILLPWGWKMPRCLPRRSSLFMNAEYVAFYPYESVFYEYRSRFMNNEQAWKGES